MMNYYQIPALANVYLEDSYVLGLRENDGEIVFDLDIVLTEEHSLYQPPLNREKYCYKRAELRFSGVKMVKWFVKRFKPFSDASGDIDYGNIDSLTGVSGVYLLEGDWGRVEITCDSVELDLLN